jgi:glutaredoxin
MRRIALLALLIGGILASAVPVAKTLYKSVGPDGRIAYSDRPPAGGRIEKTMKFDNLPGSALPASAASYVEQLRRMRASSTPSTPSTPTSGAVLYSATWCGYCKQAKAYLASKGIAYQEIDIDTKDGMAAFAQAGGGKGVPLLLAGGQRVQGFSPAAYDALFAERK